MSANFLGEPELQTDAPIVLKPVKLDGTPLSLTKLYGYAARQFIQSVHTFARDREGFEQFADLVNNVTEIMLVGPYRARRVTLTIADNKVHIALGKNPHYIHAALACYFADTLGADALVLQPVARANRRLTENIKNFLFEASRYYAGNRASLFFMDGVKTERSPILFFDKLNSPFLPSSANTRIGDQHIDSVAAKQRRMKQNPIRVGLGCLGSRMDRLFGPIKRDMAALIGFRPD